jgi:hypothetical protein
MPTPSKPVRVSRIPVGERVRALNYLETVLSTIPAATDRLESWFARPVVKCLRNMGIITLGDLVRFINVYGYRWYSTIKGFGAQARKSGCALADPGAGPLEPAGVGQRP